MIARAILFISVSCTLGCRLFRKPNYETHDRPYVVASEYRIETQKSVDMSIDSALLLIVINGSAQKLPMPYVVIDITGLQSGLTDQKGEYSVMVRSGIYNITVRGDEVFEIRDVKIAGKTKNTVRVNLGASVWH